MLKLTEMYFNFENVTEAEICKGINTNISTGIRKPLHCSFVYKKYDTTIK